MFAGELRRTFPLFYVNTQPGKHSNCGFKYGIGKFKMFRVKLSIILSITNAEKCALCRLTSRASHGIIAKIRPVAFRLHAPGKKKRKRRCYHGNLYQ